MPTDDKERQEDGVPSPLNGILEARWHNVRVKISSTHLVTLVIVLGLFGLLAFAASAALTDVHAVRIEHRTLMQEHLVMQRQWEDSVAGILYMLSLPEAQRPKMHEPTIIKRYMVSPSDMQPFEW